MPAVSQFEHEFLRPCQDLQLPVQDRAVVAEAGRLAAVLGGVDPDGSVVPHLLERAAGMADRLVVADPTGPYGEAGDRLREGAAGKLDPAVRSCALNRALGRCLRSCYLEPVDYSGAGPNHSS